MGEVVMVCFCFITLFVWRVSYKRHKKYIIKIAGLKSNYTHIAGWYIGSTEDLYFGDAWFESQPGYWLSCLRSFMFFVRPSGQLPNNYLWIRPWLLPSLFVILLFYTKVKLFLYRPFRLLRLREVEAPTLSDIWLIHGDKVVSPTCQPVFTPRKIPGTHFC
jgi:hypothetical protein